MYRVDPEKVAQVFTKNQLGLDIYSFYHEYFDNKYGCLMTALYIVEGNIPTLTGWAAYNEYNHFAHKLGMSPEYFSGFTYENWYNPEDFSSPEYELGKQDRLATLQILREAGITP